RAEDTAADEQADEHADERESHERSGHEPGGSGVVLPGQIEDLTHLLDPAVLLGLPVLLAAEEALAGGFAVRGHALASMRTGVRGRLSSLPGRPRRMRRRPPGPPDAPGPRRDRGARGAAGSSGREPAWPAPTACPRG